MSVMIKKTIWILVAVTMLAFVLGTTLRADERSKPSAQLAEASKSVVPAIAIVVPAIAIDETRLSLTDLETLPIVAVTPDETDAAIAAVIQTRALPNVATLVSAVRTARVMHPVQKASHAAHLPQTASALPLIVLLSALSIGVAFALMVFDKRRPASTA
jgi:hypothetical protein